jgi:phospholipid/cholesterol/gamma-HCH transport system permease protein
MSPVAFLRRRTPVQAPLSQSAALAPLRSVGGFFAFSLDTLFTMARPPYAWREFLEQTVFLARVALLPALMLSIPYVVLLAAEFGIVLDLDSWT